MRFWLLSFLLFIMFTAPLPSKAQLTNAQLWFEYKLVYPFSGVYIFDNAFTYSTLLSSSQWRDFNYSPSVEYSSSQYIDLIVGSSFSYTVQTQNINTLEIRPFVGTRVHFTPRQRVLTRLLAKIEQRNLKNLETGKWEKNVRPRFRLEALILINKNSYYEDKLWYGIADAEWLMKVGDDVQERFANRFRGRIGVGYRLSYSYRFEFFYMFQQSRDTIEEDFKTSDHIFRFLFKHYLRKSKPT